MGNCPVHHKSRNLRGGANMAQVLPKQNVVIETSEAQIAVHWREEEYYYPSAKFVGQANLTDPNINERFSDKNFPECFREYADLLSWDNYWHTTLDTSDPPFWKWFVGGVTANFKETQLKHMRPGERVTVHVDTSDRDYEATVESLPGAAGPVFSLFPPENATGNYVKVVQRFPVRIRFNKRQDPEHILRPGMSVEPTVKVH